MLSEKLTLHGDLLDMLDVTNQRIVCNAKCSGGLLQAFGIIAQRCKKRCDSFDARQGLYL